MLLFIFFILFSSVYGSFSEKEYTRRLDAHLLIQDPKEAYMEAQKARQLFPDSKEMHFYLIKSLAKLGKEHSLLTEYEQYEKLYGESHPLLEEISWSILQNAIHSSQYNVRLTSLLGSFMTKDAKSVFFLLSMMQDSSAILRAVAVQLACSYQDEVLKERIVELFHEEKVWFVRLEVLSAIGKMQIKKLFEPLQELITSDAITHEEKAYAIQSLVQIYDKIDLSSLEKLARNARGGLRQLACELVIHFEDKRAKDLVISLLQDKRFDVRVSAINALALVFFPFMEKEEAKALITPFMSDSHPIVAITASWACFLLDPKQGEQFLEKWVYHEHPQFRRLAACALARTGEKGVDLSSKVLFASSDPYVRANIALGLIGQRELAKECCDILYKLLVEDKRKWMWDDSKNSLFSVLSPSSLRYVEHIPNYPEAVDQIVRLEILSILTILEDKRAEDAVRAYLQTRYWGITGVASATLLQEGSEESLEIVKHLLDDKNETVRIQAALILAVFGKDEAALGILKEAYQTCEHEKKIYILEALGYIGRKEEIPFLFQALQEPFPILRSIAASSLIQCINR